MAKVSNKSLLVIALVLSLMTAILVYHYLKGVTGGQPAQEGMSVIVAKVDLSPKTKITSEMVSEVKVPSAYIQPGTVTSLDKVVGVVVRETIVSGEQISERRLVREGKTAGFTGIIPRDKRAVTVAVNEVTGVAGFVKAGDYIDVVVTFDTAAVGDNVSHVIMQNILVLAANRDTEISTAEPSTTGKDSVKEFVKSGTVTMAVTPDEAVRLTLSEEKGKIRLVLRPYLPLNSVVIAEAITPKDLVGYQVSTAKNEQVTTPQPPQPVYVNRQEGPEVKPQPLFDHRGIQVIRGTKIESIPIN